MIARERSIKVSAVILRHTDYGEADRLLWLFTRERGKLRAIAKGVRKMRSRKAGHLEPFTHASLQLALGRDLWIVTQAETIEAFLPIRENLELTAYAIYVLELLDRFTYEEGEYVSLFQLLLDTLHRIQNEEDVFLAVRYYELRILDLVGFRPQLFTCVECNETIKAEDQFFSAEKGGVLCPRCGVNAPMSRPVSMESLKYLRHFQRSPFKEAKRAHLSSNVKREMENLLQYYLTFLLERSLNSPEFLKIVRKPS